jgi:hypothetical protein
MHNLPLLEKYYQKYIKDLNSWIPDGIYFINLELLHHFDLLHFQLNANWKNPILTNYFHMIESPEKITLLNDEFVVWIMPNKVNHIPLTYTLIALNKGEREPQLEVAFIASGVYNSSALVLKILEKFLIEIHETESAISKIRDAS